MKLTEDQIQARLGTLPGWQYQQGALARQLVFTDFVQAFGFMAQVALHAEKTDHHPDWANVYNRVDIRLNTHDAGGVTEKDFALAAYINTLAPAL